jgi:hypothetical protein
MSDIFEGYNPSGFVAYARLTGGPGPNDKGYTYTIMVPVSHRDFERLSDKDFRSKYGYGSVCRTVAEARNRVQADKDMCGSTTDASGLISWGKSSPREYAIYEIVATRVE